MFYLFVCYLGLVDFRRQTIRLFDHPTLDFAQFPPYQFQPQRRILSWILQLGVMVLTDHFFVNMFRGVHASHPIQQGEIAWWPKGWNKHSTFSEWCCNSSPWPDEARFLDPVLHWAHDYEFARCWACGCDAWRAWTRTSSPVFDACWGIWGFFQLLSCVQSETLLWELFA